MQEKQNENKSDQVHTQKKHKMYTVLLSGGSGKRLWPLSNDLRSKQYIKLLSYENDDKVCSMVQRVMDQLNSVGLSDNTVICASAGQVEMLRSQLGDVPIAVEPDRRDTFPAVILACAYLASKMNANDDDVVCILPVDPYTERSTLKRLRSSTR
jgi:mannose-1-phosphate guanylyltransferase